MTIREKTRVRVIAGYYEGKTGKINSVHPEAGVAIVSFDDNGDVGKVNLSDLIEIQDQPEEKAPEIPEGAKQISRADFDAALDRVSNEVMRSGKNPMVGFTQIMTARLVADSVKVEIFRDQDVVTMTEDDFASALWDACNPATLRELNDMPTGGKVRRLAMVAYISFEEIVEILFGSPENG